MSLSDATLRGFMSLPNKHTRMTHVLDRALRVYYALKVRSIRVRMMRAIIKIIDEYEAKLQPKQEEEEKK